MITQDRLKARLYYYPNIGQFFWLNGRNKGKRAGSVNDKGYEKINLEGKVYASHRLAFLFVYGHMPSEVDHINGNKTDNRIENLRAASRRQNRANTVYKLTKHGAKGVRQLGPDRWAAYHADTYLGTFKTRDEAHAAYQGAAIARYGEYANLTNTRG